MKNIAIAFIKAKKAFGPAMKDKTNPAFRGSKYADLGACLEAVDSAFLENGIVLYQETFEDMSGVTVETVLLHESGEILRGGKFHVPASKQDPQGYGSALTYCRRYSLMTTCGFAPEDDDGNGAADAKRKADEEHNLAYADYEAEHLPILRAASMDGIESLKMAIKALPPGEFKDRLGDIHGAKLREGAAMAKVTA